jgi:hypothetical protein
MRSLLSRLAVIGLAALFLPSLAAFAEDASAVREGFRTEGSAYYSTASGKGQSAQEAEASARSAALHGLIAGLGKDGLFAEVFSASPPIGLNFQLLDSSKDGFGFKAIVQLKVDDESIRIVERGPYLAAALGILDKAEAASDEAEARRQSATAAETEADLGAALGQYGMAVDACRSALQLIDPVEDPSVFSSKGKRTAPELKKGLANVLADSLAGVERVKKAEAALAADASSAAASEVADAAIAKAAEAQALLDEINPALSDLSAYGEEKLAPMRDRLALQRRSLSDTKAALQRARDSLVKDKGPSSTAKGSSYTMDKIDFASRRLATADASLASAFRLVDREIRDPAARRAARAQAIRWAFLHQPREYLSMRAYLPFKIAAGEGGVSGAPFDANLGFEGAFAMGRGGAWVRSQVKMQSTDLEPAEPEGDELALTQSFDLGFWGKTLFFAGYTWDWLRHVDEESFPKTGAIKLGIGGVYEHVASEERFRRADWLASLSYEIPYAMSDFRGWNAFNLGLDGLFRLGDIILLEASISHRLDELPAGEADKAYAAVLRYSIGVGFRLPPPFTIGAEFFGCSVSPMKADGSLADPEAVEGGRFRFYLQYSI